MLERAIVGIYDSHADAEAAVGALQSGGVDLRRFSILGRDVPTDDHALGVYTRGDRVKLWQAGGTPWGRLWGAFAGGGVFVLPSLGSLVVMGPAVEWIVAALERSDGEAGLPGLPGGATGVLLGALSGMGIPKDGVAQYELALKAVQLVIQAHGPVDVVEEARAALSSTRPVFLTTHSAYVPPPSTPAFPAFARPERRRWPLSRAHILRLLSDAELAGVARAESEAALAYGEEYVDLSHPDRGVLHAGTLEEVHVLPRHAVAPETWSKIVSQLPLPEVLATQQEP